MAKDSGEFVVASDGAIHVAPVGTTLPTSTSGSLNAAFVDLGYATPDGVTFGDSKTVEAIRSWQSQVPTRRLITERDSTISFALQQWNRDSFELAFEGEWVNLPGGQWRFDPPAPGDPLAEKSLVIDWNDGERDFRLVVPKGNVIEGVETQLTRSAEAVLPITFSPLADDDTDLPWNIYADDEAFS